MTASRRAVHRVLDLAVFGPLGFLLEARRLVPELAERGREHVDQQVRTLRAFGRIAVRVGRPPRRSESTRDRHVFARTGMIPSAATGPGTTGPEATGPASEVDVRVVDELAAAGLDEMIDEGHLPIEGYDALAASQIVARLAGLDADELKRVQRYEAAHRGRRTILHRTGQLLSGR